ncbi:MAG: 50S ribosomal protein L15 [Actinomycetota bacterium]
MAENEIPETPAEDVRLDRLAPRPGAKRPRKRVGRGIGSGTGKTSGRGQKGLGSRAGGGVRPGYQGGQMPIYMQQGKLRGSNRKMSMPMGPFRTHSVPVNVGRLSVFDAGSVVDPDAMAAKGLVKNNANRDWPVKILAEGEIDRALTVRAHAVSAAARVKIEAAGGTVELIGEAGTTSG